MLRQILLSVVLLLALPAFGERIYYPTWVLTSKGSKPGTVERADNRLFLSLGHKKSTLGAPRCDSFPKGKPPGKDLKACLVAIDCEGMAGQINCLIINAKLGLNNCGQASPSDFNRCPEDFKPAAPGKELYRTEVTLNWIPQPAQFKVDDSSNKVISWIGRPKKIPNGLDLVPCAKLKPKIQYSDPTSADADHPRCRAQVLCKSKEEEEQSITCLVKKGNKQMPHLQECDGDRDHIRDYSPCDNNYKPIARSIDFGVTLYDGQIGAEGRLNMQPGDPYGVLVGDFSHEASEKFENRVPCEKLPTGKIAKPDGLRVKSCYLAFPCFECGDESEAETTTAFACRISTAEPSQGRMAVDMCRKGTLPGLAFCNLDELGFLNMFSFR